MNRTTPAARSGFAERHAAWGRDLRIVDVELASLSLPESDRAVVLVDFSWTRNSEASLRTTRVLQEWRDTRGGWLLEHEKRLAGDLGLFGEQLPPEPRTERHDVQFKTKIIPPDPAN